MVGIGRVVFGSRDHMIALRPRGKGMVGTTLIYPYEVHNENRRRSSEHAVA
jgi:DNA end-binding protein Ku